MTIKKECPLDHIPADQGRIRPNKSLDEVISAWTAARYLRSSFTHRACLLTSRRNASIPDRLSSLFNPSPPPLPSPMKILNLRPPNYAPRPPTRPWKTTPKRVDRTSTPQDQEAFNAASVAVERTREMERGPSWKMIARISKSSRRDLRTRLRLRRWGGEARTKARARRQPRILLIVCVALFSSSCPRRANARSTSQHHRPVSHVSRLFPQFQPQLAH